MKTPPQLGEGVHVEGQVVKLVPVACDGRIDEVVEADKAVDIVPSALVARMEDVCAVAVDVDALQPLGAGVAADVRPSFDDEALLPRLICFVGEHAAEQPRPHDEIVVLRHSLLLFVLLLHSPGRGQPRACALLYFNNSAGKM